MSRYRGGASTKAVFPSFLSTVCCGVGPERAWRGSRIGHGPRSEGNSHDLATSLPRPGHRLNEQPTRYYRSPCTRFRRSSSGSTSPSLQRSVRVSTGSSWSSLMTNETPSWSARRITVSRLVRSVVASRLRPMPVTGCSRISASSDGVKFFLYCFLFMPSTARVLAQVRDARRSTRETSAR